MLAGSLGELLNSLDLQADGALGGGDNSRHLELVSRCSFAGGLLFIRSAEDVEWARARTDCAERPARN